MTDGRSRVDDLPGPSGFAARKPGPPELRHQMTADDLAVAIEEERLRPVKQVIVIRKDLKMRRGKEIAQGAHASMAFLTRRLGHWIAEGFEEPPGCIAKAKFTRAEYVWITGSFRKITCQVPGEVELREVAAKGRLAGLEVQEIYDSGVTEFRGRRTFTAVAIGPDYADLIDPVTGELVPY